MLLGIGVAPAVAAPDPQPPTTQLQPPVSPRPLPPPAQPVAPPSAQAKPGDQLNSAFENDQLPIDPSISRHPLSHYHVFYDEGGNNILTKAPHLLQIVVGAATEAIFAFSAMLVGLAVWLLTWAFSFRFAAVLADPAARITESFQAQLIGPLSLLELAGLAAVVYMAWQFWKGQLAHGVGELAVSVLVIAIGSALVPAALLNGTMNLASQTAGAILVVGTGADPSTVPATSGQGYARQQYTRYFKAYGQTLVEQYVAVPSARLSWGTVPMGPCAAQLDKILTQGLDATDDKARDLMHQGGPDCERHAEFASHPSFWRLGGALANLFLALVIVAVVGVITGFLVAGQVGVALLIAFMRPALVVGVVPGWGRHLLHRWWTGFIKFAALAVAMSCTLVFVVVTGRAITDASATWPSPARLFAMVVVPVTAVMTAFRARRLSLRQTARLRARLESAPTGGSHGAQILGRLAPRRQVRGRQLPQRGDRGRCRRCRSAGTPQRRTHRGRLGGCASRSGERRGAGADPRSGHPPPEGLRQAGAEEPGRDGASGEGAQPGDPGPRAPSLRTGAWIGSPGRHRGTIAHNSRRHEDSAEDEDAAHRGCRAGDHNRNADTGRAGEGTPASQAASRKVRGPSGEQQSRPAAGLWGQGRPRRR